MIHDGKLLLALINMKLEVSRLNNRFSDVVWFSGSRFRDRLCCSRERKVLPLHALLDVASVQPLG